MFIEVLKEPSILSLCLQILNCDMGGMLTPVAYRRSLKFLHNNSIASLTSCSKPFSAAVLSSIIYTRSFHPEFCIQKAIVAFSTLVSNHSNLSCIVLYSLSKSPTACFLQYSKVAALLFFVVAPW